MTLQYNSSNDLLLYNVGDDLLMHDCCCTTMPSCPTCSGDDVVVSYAYFNQNGCWYQLNAFQDGPFTLQLTDTCEWRGSYLAWTMILRLNNPNGNWRWELVATLDFYTTCSFTVEVPTDWASDDECNFLDETLVQYAESADYTDCPTCLTEYNVTAIITQ